MARQRIIITNLKNGRYMFKFPSIATTCIVCDRFNRHYRLQRDKTYRYPFQSVAEEAHMAYTRPGIDVNEFYDAIIANFPGQFDIILDLKYKYDSDFKLVRRKTD